MACSFSLSSAAHAAHSTRKDKFQEDRGKAKKPPECASRVTRPERAASGSHSGPSFPCSSASLSPKSCVGKAPPALQPGERCSVARPAVSSPVASCPQGHEGGLEDLGRREMFLGRSPRSRDGASETARGWAATGDRAEAEGTVASQMHLALDIHNPSLSCFSLLSSVPFNKVLGQAGTGRLPPYTGSSSSTSWLKFFEPQEVVLGRCLARGTWRPRSTESPRSRIVVVPPELRHAAHQLDQRRHHEGLQPWGPCSPGRPPHSSLRTHPTPHTHIPVTAQSPSHPVTPVTQSPSHPVTDPTSHHTHTSQAGSQPPHSL